MIVVDASVVTKSLLPELDSEATAAFLASQACIAPDLIVSECVNAIWKNVRLGRIPPEYGGRAVSLLDHIGLTLAPTQGLAARAFALAEALDHPAYDCFYLALAEAQGVDMVTDDMGFLRKVAAASLTSAQLHALSDARP